MATTTTTAPAPPAAAPAACVGVAMVNGQADINSQPGNTTFCLSGVHNWTLTPKSGDHFVGPAVLDGGGTTTHAIVGNGTSNVTLDGLEVRNYVPGHGDAAINAQGTTGWIFRNLQVHDNGTSAGGDGAALGVSSQVVGGRFYNNRQLGIAGGGGANGWVIDGAEIDHNNFTDDTYTAVNVNCGDEAGGVKWTANNVTVQNSSIHDNGCKGLWSDGSALDSTIRNNRVFDNWDEGIFIEISNGSTITGNSVSGNGFHTNGNGCAWLWGGGITAASSANVTVTGNTVTGNCNGITGTQQNRPDGNPGLLENFLVENNTISGTGMSGVVADNGANLATRNIVFANNTITGGMTLVNV